MYRIFILLIFSFCNHLISAQAQNPSDPKHTEDWSRLPKVISNKIVNQPIPSDAIILLSESANEWTKRDGSPNAWKIENGVMTVESGAGDIISKKSFGDCQLHLEWRSPINVKGEGQGRGNSGVFLASRYEVQILDSYENETYYNGQAASVYKQHVPLANVCSKTGEWNTYDIIYRAPRFDYNGNVTENGRVTVIHNGIVVQNNVEIFGTTEYIGLPKTQIHGGAPLILQDHGDLVSYRNIWIRRL